MRISIKELKEMAKDANVKGYTSMKKDELISKLQVTRKYGLILDYMQDYGISLEEAKDMAR